MLRSRITRHWRRFAPHDPPSWLGVVVAVLFATLVLEAATNRLDFLFVDQPYADFLIWVAINATGVAVLLPAFWLVYNAAYQVGLALRSPRKAADKEEPPRREF